jgi:hypothetical protein
LFSRRIEVRQLDTAVQRIGPGLNCNSRRELRGAASAFLTSGTTSESLPSISSYPRNLHHLTYTSTFGGFSFERFGTDGPWAFFDDQANTFIYSAASHYMNAVLSFGPHGELVGGIAADSEGIPAGFVGTAVLVIAPGIRDLGSLPHRSRGQAAPRQ